MVSCLFLSHYHAEIHTEISRDETAQYVGFASNHSFVVVTARGRNNKEYSAMHTQFLKLRASTWKFNALLSLLLCNFP